MRDAKSTVIYNWFQKVWTEGQAGKIGDFLTENSIGHNAQPDGTATHGREEFRQFYEGFRSQFKDIHITVQDVIAQDDMETAICDVQATFIPTNTPTNFSGICAVRIENGKIAEAWNHFDFLKMYKQIGFELVAKV